MLTELHIRLRNTVKSNKSDSIEAKAYNPQLC